ncbi:hypothetical protein MUP37_04925 [Candidatus Bathyarchaeota archaeon]|nr:hypothetical protein [Candidatus Bathyarchaeota archaeon]
MLAVSEIGLSVIWGTIFGVIYAKLYASIPRKGISKGLIFGLIIWFIAWFRPNLFVASAHPYEGAIWASLRILQALVFGLVLGALYKK